MPPARNGAMMNLEIVEEYGMLPRGSRVLCAVSGGADSMCLLHLLFSKREELGIEVLAAHYEHGLRGEESLRDAAFVESWCGAQGIPFVIEHGDVAGYAARKGLGDEEAARELRYAFLHRAAGENGCGRIATAHNADDNAETILFNLCRGGGAAGLRGIPPVRGEIVRPLLGCSREDIEEYLEKNAVPHVEDSTNQADDYSRNRIRHKVIPVLREINPAFSAAAGRTARLLREDEACLQGMAGDFIEKNSADGSLPAAELAALPKAVASRVLRRVCPRSLSLAHVEAALALCRGQGLGYADLPGIRIRREQGRIYFDQREKISLPQREIVPGESLEIPEAGIKISAYFTEKNKEINDLFKTYCFKYESICGIISCTGRRPGDSIRPLGRNCTKSLKKLFSEAGFSQTERDSTPVFRDEKGILAVYGLAVAERTAAKCGDKVLCIEIEKADGEITERDGE